MAEIKDSGDRTEFATGAVRDMHEGKGRFDLLPMCVLLRLAQHYENGCQKYGDRNWEKGILCHSFADSAMRHLVKYMDGWDDEDHLIAAIWNLCGLAWTEEKKPELMDIPARMKKTPYKAQMKWHDAKVEQPSPFVSVLCYMPGEKPLPTVREGFLTTVGNWMVKGYTMAKDEVTHWMEMPVFQDDSENYLADGDVE